MDCPLTRPLEEEISHRICAEGKITFAEFMGLALYWPRGGYYRGPSPVGTGGDFYTAPGAHPSFGALLCLQLYQMWRLLGSPNPFWVVEAGAGSGLLSRDVVRFSESLPGEFDDSLQYLSLDTSTGNSPREGAHHLTANGLPLTDVVGCILSNELIDAFPVHMVEQRDGRLLEIYITQSNGQIVEELGEPSSPALCQRLESLGIVLVEGQRTEMNLAMGDWLGEASQALKQGYILTIDYGREAEELYSRERFRGTLTTFFRHTQTDSPYTRIGKQDMTAQVDFTTLQSLGEDFGLTNCAYLTQSEFLSNMGLRRWIARLPALGPSQQQRDANRMGMLQLARPEGMGDFKVLIQGKNAPSAPLWGRRPDSELQSLIERLHPPLLTYSHMPLLLGNYPYYGADSLDIGSG